MSGQNDFNPWEDDELYDGVDDADHFFLADNDIQDIIDDLEVRETDDSDSEGDGDYVPHHTLFHDDDDEELEEEDDEDEDEDEEEESEDDTPQYPGGWPQRVYLVDDDDSDSETGVPLGPRQLQELATLFNSETGISADARSTLLQHLLGRTVGHSMRTLRRPAEDPAARRRGQRWWTPQREPHPAGLALLRGGEFGPVGPWTPASKPEQRGRRPGQRYGRMPVFRSSEPTIPNTHGTVVASYPSVPYVGQYCGPDYGVFYSATQHFTLHLYSTNQPKTNVRRHTTAAAPSPPPEDAESSEDDMWGRSMLGRRRRAAMREDSSMRKIKNVQGVEGQWTVTDADADRSGQRMIYSSITPYVHMLYTAEHDAQHIRLDFSSRDGVWGHDHFGIWSIRFSADGKEVVAGAGAQTDGRIMVYDIEAERRILSVPGHRDDVNAVCFADESSTNVLVSGSDDGYVKVWDRRSLSSNTPSGVLVGATEGITYTAPKGDGRYIVVNSKDQAARLYDLRMMRSWSEFSNEPDAVAQWGQANFDYRQMRYNAPKRLAHPRDCSVMTYRGHSVLQTLIRCHFSPVESTGQSYIYSGSADGLIHIWSLDGRVVQVLNRAESVPLRDSAGNYNDPSAPEPVRGRRRVGANAYEHGERWTVRDVAWHGYEPTLMSTCWELEGSFRHGGSIAKHEWKGLGKGGLRSLEDWVEKTAAEGEQQQSGSRGGERWL